MMYSVWDYAGGRHPRINVKDGKIVLFLNGLLQAPGKGRDYIVRGNKVRFLVPLRRGDRIVAYTGVLS